MGYEFTKEKLKELNWPRTSDEGMILESDEESEDTCVVGRDDHDGDYVGSNVEMDRVVDLSGNDVVDATMNLFPGLSDNNLTTRGVSVGTKQLSGDETDVEDDDGVLPHPRKSWPKGVPKMPKRWTSTNRHLFYRFGPKGDDAPDAHIAESRYQIKLKSSSSFVSEWRQPAEHEQSPSEADCVLDEKEMNAFVAKAFASWGWGTNADFQKDIQKRKRKHEKVFALMKNSKVKVAKASLQTQEIERLKRERKQYRRAVGKEFKFGISAMVVGLK